MQERVLETGLAESQDAQPFHFDWQRVWNHLPTVAGALLGLNLFVLAAVELPVGGRINAEPTVQAAPMQVIADSEKISPFDASSVVPAPRRPKAYVPHVKPILVSTAPATLDLPRMSMPARSIPAVNANFAMPAHSVPSRQ